MSKTAAIIPKNRMKNWQEIADILADIAKVPTALVMKFTPPEIEVLISSKSNKNPYKPGDKEILFNSGLYCETVIKTKKRLFVSDALTDPDWSNNPDIKLNMISYLGFPILLPDNTPFGTLCILDEKPNKYSGTIEKLMQKFIGLIEADLEMIYRNKHLSLRNKKLIRYLMALQGFQGLVSICSNCKSIKDTDENWRPIEYFLIKHPEAKFSHSICPKCKESLYQEP